MLWKLCWNAGADLEALSDVSEGRRFVLHRHRDGQGAHWDLRLEQDGYLMGWRIEGDSLEAETLALEKSPHEVLWLERDGDAVREDEGRYAWLCRDADGGELELRGRSGVRRVSVRRAAGLSARSIEALGACLRAHGVAEEGAAALIEDGLRARQRAVSRLCGLGRELDGRSFSDDLWKKSLQGLSLREIEAHLAPYEARFDAKYPPQATSRPEALSEEAGSDGERVLALLRG